MRHALMDACTDHVTEPAELRRRLAEAGFERLVGRLDAMAGALHWWTRPEAARSDVEQGFAQVVSLHHKMRTLHRELRADEAALGQEMTEENLGHLTEVQAQIAVMEGLEAQIDGFGTLSGRSV